MKIRVNAIHLVSMPSRNMIRFASSLESAETWVIPPALFINVFILSVLPVWYLYFRDRSTRFLYTWKFKKWGPSQWSSSSYSLTIILYHVFYRATSNSRLSLFYGIESPCIYSDFGRNDLDYKICTTNRFRLSGKVAHKIWARLFHNSHTKQTARNGLFCY